MSPVLCRTHFFLNEIAQVSFNGKEVDSLCVKIKATNKTKENATMKVKDCALRWLDEVKSDGRKWQTYLKYSKIVRLRILPQMGETEMAELNEAALRGFLSQQRNSRKGCGLSVSSVNQIVAVLNGVFGYAAEKGIIPTGVRVRMSGVRRTAGSADVFDRREQAKLEREIERWSSHNPRCEGYRIALYTGLRIGELAALRWQDVDLANGIINIVREAYYAEDWDGRYRMFIDTPKSLSSVRSVPMPDGLKKYLRRLRAAFPCSVYVLPGRSGGLMNICAFRSSFISLQKRCGLRVRNFHVLRHTYATRLLEEGTDFKTLSELLGHESPAVTMRVYGHTLMRTKKLCVNRLGKLLRGMGE